MFQLDHLLDQLMKCKITIPKDIRLIDITACFKNLFHSMERRISPLKKEQKHVKK